jgi:hypothetical protein
MRSRTPNNRVPVIAAGGAALATLTRVVLQWRGRRCGAVRSLRGSFAIRVYTL